MTDSPEMQTILRAKAAALKYGPMITAQAKSDEEKMIAGCMIYATICVFSNKSLHQSTALLMEMFKDIDAAAKELDKK